MSGEGVWLHSGERYRVLEDYSVETECRYCGEWWKSSHSDCPGQIGVLVRANTDALNRLAAAIENGVITRP